MTVRSNMLLETKAAPLAVNTRSGLPVVSALHAALDAISMVQSFYPWLNLSPARAVVTPTERRI